MTNRGEPLRAPATESRPRLAGVDAMRWIAAVGVVVVHCGDKQPAAEFVGKFFLNFAVPFFYAAGAYFLVRETLITGEQPRLATRLRRLLVPYVCWSAIYLGARLAKGVLLGSVEHRAPWSTEGWRVVFLGGAAVHLYFLPVLALGLITGWLLAPVLRWLAKRPAGLAFAVALAWGGFLAFDQWEVPRSIPPGLLTALRCLSAMLIFGPYLLASVMLQLALEAAGDVAGLQSRRIILPAALVVFVGMNTAFTFGWLDWDWTLVGWLLAFPLLLAALAWRADFARHPSVAAIMPLSFGVYLVHHLVIEAFRMGARLLGFAWPERVSIPQMLLLTGATVAVSLVIAWQIGKSAFGRRGLLGMTEPQSPTAANS
jgi:peptidoglycan/LPS O-acetylase OafA/YrhL